MVNQSEHYLVSVIMAIYNPSWEKCVFTLESVIAQKNIDFELIVTDDGSSDNLFYKFEEYFKNTGFRNYKLIDHNENKGTVKNYYDGVKVATGKYVKLISPGDALFSDDVLNEWSEYLAKSGRKWSFSDAVFYQVENGNKRVTKAPAFPRLIDCYIAKDFDRCRWNYIVLEDVALGAALLCEKDVFCIYLEKFIGKVRFAEDVAFVSMMYDNILPAYYSVNTIFYEYGTGVSTGENKWLLLIRQDQKNAENIIVSEKPGDELQKKMTKALVNINSSEGFRKKILKNFQKGGIKKVLKHRFFPRMSSVDISNCGKWWTE